LKTLVFWGGGQASQVMNARSSSLLANKQVGKRKERETSAQDFWNGVPIWLA
jgi:hypothetical protein